MRLGIQTNLQKKQEEIDLKFLLRSTPWRSEVNKACLSTWAKA